MINPRVEEKLLEQVSKEPSTFADLWRYANDLLGFRPGDRDGPGYRYADRWLQRKRKAGVIQLTRIGRQTFWSLHNQCPSAPSTTP